MMVKDGQRQPRHPTKSLLSLVDVNLLIRLIHSLDIIDTFVGQNHIPAISKPVCTSSGLSGNFGGPLGVGAE